VTCSVSVLQGTEDLAVIESERLAVEGYNAASREQYMEAVEYFTKAIRIVHNDHRFYGNRSFCCCQLGQYAK
jgi:Flp pilus assembly protein TadD